MTCVIDPRLRTRVVTDAARQRDPRTRVVTDAARQPATRAGHGTGHSVPDEPGHGDDQDRADGQRDQVGTDGSDVRHA